MSLFTQTLTTTETLTYLSTSTSVTMLSLTRSPLTSPAIRTVISASSYTSFPFHHAAPSSPLSRQTHSLSQRNLPGSPRVPREPTAQIPGSPTFGSYFNLGAQATSPSHLGSPQFLALPQIVVNMPPAPSSGEKHLTVSKLPQTELTPVCQCHIFLLHQILISALSRLSNVSPWPVPKPSKTSRRR
jgi:hypothetical protein